MIRIGDQYYGWEYFPNNEIKFPDIDTFEAITQTGNVITVKWLYEKPEEVFVLQMIKRRLDDLVSISNKIKKIALVVPFLPYGQSDRKMTDNLFSFKYFADIINSMNFDSVSFTDPHSIIMEALIKKAKVTYLPQQWWFDMYFYPDQGACKKYSEIYDKPYRFGNKKRNLDTGEILSYEIIGKPHDFEFKNILIVDDLCMGGRTFKEAVKALNAYSPASISLQITHFMPQSKEFLQNFKDYGISSIYTQYNGISDLVFTKENFETIDEDIHFM